MCAAAPIFATTLLLGFVCCLADGSVGNVDADAAGGGLKPCHCCNAWLEAIWVATMIWLERAACHVDAPHQCELLGAAEFSPLHTDSPSPLLTLFVKTSP